MHPNTPPVTVDMTVDRVADLLATVAVANRLIADEAERICNSRAAVSLATLERLTTLTAELRPGAEARAALSELGPDLLLAGTSVWVARHRTAANGYGAAARAAIRWGAAPRLEDGTGEGEVGA